MIIHLKPLLCFLLLLLFSSISAAFTAQGDENKNDISFYVSTESFSNILPIKQLIKDEWKQRPDQDASHAFTQNEVGIRLNWNNVLFGVAHRLDYFVNTHADTAEAFYLERAELPLTTKDHYDVALRLHHQQSNGIRLGYQWDFESITAQINVGYWYVTETRDSTLTGQVSGDIHNNISGTAELTEFYSDKNFLKRGNNNDWQTDGYGATLDIALAWQMSEALHISLDVKDLYAKFKLKKLGFSQGNLDTDGTFINSLGGQSYLPLYRGVEGKKDYQFELPEHINLIAAYNLASMDKSLSLLVRYKRQGEIDFYYLGAQWQHSQSSQTRVMLDIENLSPEIQYVNQWLSVKLGIDTLNLDKAKQLTLGVAFNKMF